MANLLSLPNLGGYFLGAHLVSTSQSCDLIARPVLEPPFAVAFLVFSSQVIIQTSRNRRTRFERQPFELAL